MRGAFDDQELEPVKSRRDTEVTLGSGALLTLFLGLALLCLVCFGLGYAIGHRGATQAAAALPVPSQPIGTGNAIAKPSATAQPGQSPDADDSGQAASAAASGATSAANSGATAQIVPAAATSNGEPSQPSVHPALAVAPAQAPPAQVPPASVQPAMVQGSAAPAGSLPAGSPPAGSLMVQIAAVSHPEDAAVLTDALRKRGYAVTARRDPTDNLIHVCMGPFATLAEANTWRMKLLNDGYNAIVQQ